MYVEISGAFRGRSLPVYPLLTLLLLFAPDGGILTITIFLVMGDRRRPGSNNSSSNNQDNDYSQASSVLTRTCSCTPFTLLRPTAPRFPAGRPTPRLYSTRSSQCSRSPRRSPFLPPRPTPLSTRMSLPTPIKSTSISLLPTGPARSFPSSTLPLE